MASGVYAKSRGPILKADLDLDGDLRVILVSAAYMADLSADDMLEDIDAGARISTAAVALAGKVTSAVGVFDADDTTFPTVTGAAVVAAVIYLHTGTESTSKLLSRHEFAAPVTPDGTDIIVRWSAADKILTAS